MLVLEEVGHAQRRDVPILAEVVGYGATSDAVHVTLARPGRCGCPAGGTPGAGQGRPAADRHRHGQRARHQHAGRRPGRAGGLPDALRRVRAPRQHHRHQGRHRPHPRRGRRHRGRRDDPGDARRAACPRPSTWWRPIPPSATWTARPSWPASGSSTWRLVNAFGFGGQNAASSSGGGRPRVAQRARARVDGEAAELVALIDRLEAVLAASNLSELEVEVGETALVLRKPVALAGRGGGRDARGARERRRRASSRAGRGRFAVPPGAGPAHRPALPLAEPGRGALRAGGARGQPGPGDRPHRGHEALQRDQVRRARPGGAHPGRAWRADQGAPAASWTSIPHDSREATAHGSRQRPPDRLGPVRPGARPDQPRSRPAGRDDRRVDHLAHGHPRAPRRRAARDDGLAGGRGGRPRPGRGRPGPGRPRPHPGRHLHARLRHAGHRGVRQGGDRRDARRGDRPLGGVLRLRLRLLGRPRLPRQRAVPLGARHRGGGPDAHPGLLATATPACSSATARERSC